jgi:tetratricopeptide (TPR) repeat protein
VAGRPADAEASYRRAISLRPDWAEPANQLVELYPRRWDNHAVQGVGLGYRNNRGMNVIQRADAARNAMKYRAAAALYEKALLLAPNDPAIHIQCGHMFKEVGELLQAEKHYLQAQQLTPDDPDLALQFGHFCKTAARLREAELAFRKAADLDPDWPEPTKQLAELYRRGWRNHEGPGTARPNGATGFADFLTDRVRACRPA